MGISLPDRRAFVLAAAVAVAGGLGIAGIAAAADIAIIDYQTIFDRYEGTSDAQRTLDRELKDWDAEAKEMRAEIDRLGDEIESQRLMLSEDRLREKTSELDALKKSYQSFAESIWGVNGKAAQRNAELTGPIAEKILDIVAKIGAEEKVDVILDASTGGVVWAKDEVNLTQIVLDDLSVIVQRERDEAERSEEGDADESTDLPEPDAPGGDE